MYYFYWYPKCSTCRKAKNWLDSHQINYQLVDMIATPPTATQLATWIEQSDWSIQRFFNTSGVRYREQGLKEQVGRFSIEEASNLLSTDGMLIRRPILVENDLVIVNGFKEALYEEGVKKK